MTRHSCIKNKHRLAGAKMCSIAGKLLDVIRKKVGAGFVLFCFHFFLPVISLFLHTEPD